MRKEERTIAVEVVCRRYHLDHRGVCRRWSGCRGAGPVPGLAEQRAAPGVEAVGMDMREACLISTRKYLPDAYSKIVHDTFHLISYLNEAANLVLRQ